MRKLPIEAQDVREEESCAVEGENESEMLQDRGEKEHAVGLEIGINMVPGVTKTGFEVQDGKIEELLTLQSGEIETQVGEQRRRNPRRGKQSDTINT
jgi:hypothetical protein